MDVSRWHKIKEEVAQALRKTGEGLVDFLLPPLCLNCEQPVTQNQTLCAACWKELHFVAPPLCARCGAPFDLVVEEGTLCGHCLDHPPSFTMARSALIYDDASRGLILKLKHADQLHPVPALANWMVRALEKETWEDADLIVPVPLHRWRLLKRRYNQAALLALAIGKQVHRPVDVDLLVRAKATESQGHKSAKQRRENVAKAFALRAKADVAGKKVILIDDVLTSGATVQACSDLLLQAGVASVFVVTLARTRIAS